MSPVSAVLRRELRSYFVTPVAYVFLVIFLVLAGILTFYAGDFYERGQADLVDGIRVTDTTGHLLSWTWDTDRASTSPSVTTTIFPPSRHKCWP